MKCVRCALGAGLCLCAGVGVSWGEIVGLRALLLAIASFEVSIVCMAAVGAPVGKWSGSGLFNVSYGWQHAVAAAVVLVRHVNS